MSKPHPTETEAPPHSPSDSGEMEIVRDFNDLQIEIVSGSAAAPVDPVPLLGLSIDDFTFESSAPVSQPVPKKRDEWFTKVLGQALGPFPFEKLIEMVSQGEVGRHDQIRHGEQQPWIVAGDIEGLFPDEGESTDDGMEDDGDDFELGVQIGEDNLPVTPGTGSRGFQAVGGEINRVMVNRPTPAAGTTPPAAPALPPRVVASAQPQAAASAAPVPEPKPERVKLTKEEAEALKKQKIAERLNAWLADKVQTPDPPAVETPSDEDSPAQNFAATAPSAGEYSPAGGPAYGGYTPGNPTAPGYGGGGYGGAGYGGAGGYGAAAGARPLPPQFKKKSSGGNSSLGGLKELFGSIPKPEVDPKIFIVLGVLALVFGLMYLPSLIGGTNDNKFYNRYKEIYAQLQQLRANNPGQLSSLGPTVIPEIQEMVDRLEKDGAGSKKPIKQQLFWAGKNCLIPLLNSPPPKPGDYDKRFQTHMETAGRMLGDPTVPPLPPPVQLPEGAEDMVSPP